MIRVYSSHGTLAVEPDSGLVVVSESEYCKPGDPEGIEDIHRIDLEEFCLFWGGEPKDADILDVGYWTKEGLYEPPAWDWRFECALGLLLEYWLPDEPVPESITPEEVLEVAAEGRAFGSCKKYELPEPA